MDRTFWPAILILAIGFAILESTGIDLRVQDCSYTFQTKAWLVDSSAPLPQAPQSVDTLDALTGGVFTAPTSAA